MRSLTESPEPPTEAPTRRRRPLLAMLAGAALVAVVASGCNIPVEEWVPDFDGDGQITQAEIDRQTAVLLTAVNESVDLERRKIQEHPFLTCVRHHESDRSGAWPHIGGYGAQNPRSSASGAYQFIDSSWRTLSARAGHPGYARAKYAPWWAQDAVILHTVNSGGRSHWNGTGC